MALVTSPEVTVCGVCGVAVQTVVLERGPDGVARHPRRGSGARQRDRDEGRGFWRGGCHRAFPSCLRSGSLRLWERNWLALLGIWPSVVTLGKLASQAA